jgi:hypothetical protein
MLRANRGLKLTVVANEAQLFSLKATVHKASERVVGNLPNP